MRLHDVRKTVVYIGLPSEEGMELYGTGFIVKAARRSYLVTAAHVIGHFREAPFAIRLNDKAGRLRVERITTGAWWGHPTDEDLDVAVMQIQLPEWANVTPWTLRWTVQKSGKDVGAGDAAYIVGMYALLSGASSNTPIVHTGHIAMTPGKEAIPANNPRGAVEGYLIEAESLRGLSGSPVFVKARRNPRIRLLGLWHGAWYGPPTKEKDATFRGSREAPARMGIAIPARRIVEIINREELTPKARPGRALAARRAPSRGR